MEAQKQFSEKEALQLIEQTIINTKQKIKDDGFSLVMWGWIVIVGNILSYIAITQELNYLHLYWAVACPVGGVLSGLRGSEKGKKEINLTHMGNAIKYVWVGSGMAAVILWFAAFNFGWQYINSAMFVAFAIPVFITGGMMKFKPAIFGGLILFLFGVLCFFMANYSWVYLLASIGWALGYLVPGYILKKGNV